MDAPTLERILARNAATLVEALDPEWGSETIELAGGWLVISGPGLYVNRAIAAGIDEPLSTAEIDVLVERSRAHGVAPSVEAGQPTHPGTLDALRARGFTHVADSDITLLTRRPAETEASHPAIEIRDAELAEWIDAACEGWGHTTAPARHAAAAYARAAEAVGDLLLLAIDADDGRTLGCASLTARSGVAELGGMSTLPAERGRGVQSALIHRRLAEAARGGCTLAVSTARTGSISERNLMRHGFEPQYVLRTFTLDEET